MLKTGLPTETELEDLVMRVRKVVEPQRIYLFGSLARGKFGPESDIDILVQLPDSQWHEMIELNMKMYEQLAGFGRPVDILVATERQMLEHASTPGYIYQDVALHGRPIYEAAA